MSAPTKDRPVAAADAKGKKGKDDAEDGEVKKGGKLKLIIIAVVALLAIGAGLYFFVFAGSGDDAEPAPVAGIVLPLDSVTVNLAGGGYLKVGVTLQLTEEAGDLVMGIYYTEYVTQ